MIKAAIYGGSFSPPHLGHSFCVNYLSSLFDKVMVIPVGKHPYQKCLEQYYHRYNMCCLAFGNVNNVEVSDLEKVLSDADNIENTTFYTVLKLKQMHPDWDIHFVVGTDIEKEIRTKWYRGDDLLTMASAFVIPRKGYDKKSIAPDISSTEIRESIFCGDGTIAKQYLTKPVYDYIMKEELYK